MARLCLTSEDFRCIVGDVKKIARALAWCALPHSQLWSFSHGFIEDIQTFKLTGLVFLVDLCNR
jgi:hypothetical protein